MRSLTLGLAAVLGGSLVGLDRHLEQGLQVGHGGQLPPRRDAPCRAAGPKLRARGPRGDIRRQELRERPGHILDWGGGDLQRCARDQSNPVIDK